RCCSITVTPMPPPKPRQRGAPPPAEHRLDFSWIVCPDGYILGTGHRASGAQEDVVAPLSQRENPYRPLEQGGIYLKLAAVKTDSDVIAFANQYGLLRHPDASFNYVDHAEGNSTAHHAEPLDLWLREAR